MAETKKIKCAEYDELVARVQGARDHMYKTGKAAVSALFKQFFAEYPAAKAVGWTQSTPAYNDGDPCTLCVGSPHVCTVDRDFDDVSVLGSCAEDDEDAFLDEYECEEKEKALAAALSRLEMSMDPDIFEAVFGDGVMVIATPDGFHVNDYCDE